MNEGLPFLEEVWKKNLTGILNDLRMRDLFEFIHAERRSGKKIYPKQDLLFNALNSTSLEKVKVVILGQDPYHGAGQAHGLSFSVERGVKIPPSLRNIYKELVTDTKFVEPSHGDLTCWAKQGILLLNSVLSVEEGMPASHKNKGWEWFTDRVIELVNQHCNGVVFMLWGTYAQKKGQSIDQQRHLVLSSAHPSPLSAHRGFFGCQHFSKANVYLRECGESEINWQIQ